MSAFARDRFTWLTYLLLAYYAYLESVLAPLMPHLRDEMDLSYTVGGLHFSAYAFGSLIGGLILDRLIRRFGRRVIFWGGGGGMALSGLVITVGLHPAITIPGALFMGFLGSFLVTTIQSGLSDRHGELRTVVLTEANIAASLAASLSPLVVGAAIWISVGWRGALYFSAATWVLAALFFYREPIPNAPQPDPDGDDPLVQPLPPVFWGYLGVLMLGVAAEWGIALWAADFLEDVVAFSKVTASSLVWVFFSAMMLGRWAGSRLARTRRSERLLIAALVVALAGFPLFWLAPFAPLNVVGLFIAGLGVANLYPLTMAIAVGVAPERADAASARVTLGASIAALVIPQFLGWVADLTALKTAYSVIVVILVLAILLAGLANRRAARHNLI